MAVSVNWPTKVITVPKADTVFVETSPSGLEIRQLNLATFKNTLGDLTDEEVAMPFLPPFSYVGPINVGGVALAAVLEIINGYTITFEDGQYAVNLVGLNSNVGDNVNVNQVSIRTANSAGLTFSKQVEDSAFGDQRVWIDTAAGQAGTAYPIGTTSTPVDNLADAQTIIGVRGLAKRLHVTGAVVTTGSDDLSEYNILGDSSHLSSLTVTTGTVTTDMHIESMTLTGVLDGHVSGRNGCTFDTITDFNGRLTSSGLLGTIDLGFDGNQIEFIDCFSEVAGTNTPIIDCDSISANNVQFRRYSGGVEIKNFVNGGSVMSIDMAQGNVILDSTCVGGTIVVRGIATLTDNTGAGCTVVTSGLVQPDRVAEIYRRLGLDKANPLTNKADGGLEATGISVLATDGGGGDIIQTRQ